MAKKVKEDTAARKRALSIAGDCDTAVKCEERAYALGYYLPTDFEGTTSNYVLGCYAYTTGTYAGNAYFGTGSASTPLESVAG